MLAEESFLGGLQKVIPGGQHRAATEDWTEEQGEFLGRIRRFIEGAGVYRSALREMETKLKIINEEFRLHYGMDLIHHMESRLKTPRSILRKIRRKGLPPTIDAVRKNITDIAGIRVVCNYIADVYTIADLILQQDDVILLARKDYIASPKPNGYRSLHLLVKIPVFSLQGKVLVPIEIQIRTIVMDAWASLEHQLKYKSNRSVDKGMLAELKNCAQLMAQVDEKMQRLYEERGKRVGPAIAEEGEENFLDSTRRRGG